MAPPIATPMPQRRGDGFTIMEGKLMTLFFDQFKSKSTTTQNASTNASTNASCLSP
jgi:hypothetical protein